MATIGTSIKKRLGKKHGVPYPCTKCEHYPPDKCTCDKYVRWEFGKGPFKDKVV